LRGGVGIAAMADMTSKAQDNKASHFYMMVIGIGYLFPISAIWAAFDYWKAMFPNENVEFVVTCVYQFGSVVTVLVLSVGSGFAFAPRIFGGFAGQFACLAAIMGARWLVLPEEAMFHLLLGVVALVSVATGFLDSALFSLCSQYSPAMQGSLQIGIGLGTFVSVIYRDITKLVLSKDLVNATTAYFAIALLTIVFCAFCYRQLMRLPVSRHIFCGVGLETSLLDTNGVDSTVTPRQASFSAVSPATPMLASPGGVRRPSVSLELEDSAAHEMEDAEARFGVVWGLVWRNQLTIFLNLFLTTLCYPGIITSMPCRQMLSLEGEHWYQTLLLTAFTLADTLARFQTHRRLGLYYGNIWITVILRAALFPAMLFCVMSSAAPDILAFIVVAIFGALNGYCVSLSLIVVNEIPKLSAEQRKTCGRISAFSVNGGLCLGSFCGAMLAYSLGLGSN